MLRKYITFICFIFLLSSCNDRPGLGKKESLDLEAKESFSAPKITPFNSLADSLKPKIIQLSKKPKAQRVLVPVKDDKPYINGKANDETKLFLHPPEIRTIPYFKNIKGNPQKDPTGNPLISGEGGFYHFTNYTSNDGLAIDRITAALLDRSGNIWFATAGGGVSRFDGQSFTNYTSAQGLVNNAVWCIVEDKKGNIWFGTRGGVSKFDGHTFTNYTTSKGLPNNNILCMVEDKKGNLWFGTDSSISKFDGNSFSNFSNSDRIVGKNIRCMIEDRKGNLWIATNIGISEYDGNSFTDLTEKQGLINNNTLSIYEDKIGNIWFGTDGGLSKYDGNSISNYTIDQGLASNSIRCVTEDQNGDLWFGTDGGVSKYNGKTFSSVTTNQGLINNSVLSITEDKTGNLWFGTEAGVSKYEGKSFINFTTTQGLASNIVWSIAQDNKGNYWIGTGGGGVSKYEGRSFTGFTTAQGLVNNSVRSILKDKKGNLWFGTFGGISKFDGKAFTNYTMTQGLVSNFVRSIIEDKSGNLWIGTNSGISKFDGNSFTNFTTLQGLANNSVWNICEDKIGNLWFATAGGVSKYNGNSITNYTIDQGLASNTIRCVTEDKKGNLWFGTEGGGVSKFDGKSFSNFTNSEGLADDVAYDIVEDKDGNIIIGTNLGFTVLQAGITSLPFSEIRKKIQYYSFKRGYPVKYINPNAMYLDDKGILWTGTGSDQTGLVRFEYAELLKKKVKPVIGIRHVIIKDELISWNSLNATGNSANKSDSLSTPAYITEEITIHGRKLNTAERNALQQKYKKVKFNGTTPFYPVPQKLVLPYRQNRITIEFGTDELSRPSLMEYQYILEGYDDEWSPVINKTTATFGNIKEGNYTFKVIARYTGVAEMGADNWSEPAVFTFKVDPPWFRTWWAYSIYLIFFMLIIVYLYLVEKARTIRKEKEKNKEKELAQAKEIEKAYLKLEETHENLKSTQSQLIHSEKMASLGELTAGIAHEIQNPLNFVNNFSEVSTELVDEMNTEMQKGNLEDAKLIAQDLKENLEKINHHGKRAGDIVKGMLQHSRISSGVKEPTDLNKLSEEYLRLAYHGLRAKDKSFNATMQTDFDESIGNINIIPQEIGRVILNLINNAFYAVDEKKKKQPDYEPVVTVSTKRLSPPLPGSSRQGTSGAHGGEVLISVKDNGNGIPQKILDKIFQPFFTTKPTGQGTGLGLSLSYDIVKAHGGEIKVETKEGEGSEFIISIPI
jgi:ligand-binding sensor domain-containing protein/signal transduction histidine kinase